MMYLSELSIFSLMAGISWGSNKKERKEGQQEIRKEVVNRTFGLVCRICSRENIPVTYFDKYSCSKE